METTKLHFKGKGEHSVAQLEAIIEQQKEELHQKQIINQDLLENKKQIIEQIVNDLPTRDMRGEMTKEEWYGWFEECWDKAINYTHSSTFLLCLVDDFNFLTKDKVYKMQEEPEGHYVVIDDLGEKRLLWKKYFKILDKTAIV